MSFRGGGWGVKWSYLEGVCECVASSVLTVLLVGLILKCCFMSIETVRLIRDGSPGRPLRLSHSS